MNLKIKYAPPTSNTAFGIIFILMGFGFIIGTINLELIDGLESEQDWMFVGAIISLFVMGFKNLIQAAYQSEGKEIYLNNETITIPSKNNSNTDTVAISDIQETTISNDIYLNIITTKNSYTIDCSWIAEKDKLKQLIQKLVKEQ